MASFSQGRAEHPLSLEEALCSELIYIFATPQEILCNNFSHECMMPDLSLSPVRHYERMWSVAWRERAGSKGIPLGTILMLGLADVVYEQHGTSHYQK